MAVDRTITRRAITALVVTTMFGLLGACTPSAPSTAPDGSTPGATNGPVDQKTRGDADRAAVPVAEGFGQGLLTALGDPTAPPIGANDWSCRPSAAHPAPVILVHGTAANMADSWQAVAPTLVNDGYCVFALNYGGGAADSFFGGLVSMSVSSMTEFGPFVDRVLAATGAHRVDLIGHSQGGVMPRYWMRHGNSVNADGTPKVRTFVGIAAPGVGTTFYGLTGMLDLLGTREALTASCGSCVEMVADSSWLAALDDPVRGDGDQFAGPVQPGVRYVMLATRYDNVVMPWRSGFIEAPGVENVLVQDACDEDFSDHLGLVYDPVTLRLILNALDPTTAAPPTCRWVPPVFDINWSAY